MSDYWHIRVPHRTMHDHLVNVAAWCRHLDGPNNEREVTRQIALNELGRGLKTSGGLIVFLESLTPGQRRELIDEARSDLSLPSTHAIQAAEPPPPRPIAIGGEFDPLELPHYMRPLNGNGG